MASEDRIEQMFRELAVLRYRVEQLERGRASGGAAPAAAAAAALAPAAPEVATDEDLDGQYGDPEVKRDPPRWAGQAHAPCRMSQTSPEYLATLASFLDWRASRAESENAVSSSGRPTAPLIRRDAARARGWALRLATGWRAPAPAPVAAPPRPTRPQRSYGPDADAPDDGNPDDLPF